MAINVEEYIINHEDDLKKLCKKDETIQRAKTMIGVVLQPQTERKKKLDECMSGVWVACARYAALKLQNKDFHEATAVVVGNFRSKRDYDRCCRRVRRIVNAASTTLDDDELLEDFLVATRLSTPFAALKDWFECIKRFLAIKGSSRAAKQGVLMWIYELLIQTPEHRELYPADVFISQHASGLLNELNNDTRTRDQIRMSLLVDTGIAERILDEVARNYKPPILPPSPSKVTKDQSRSSGPDLPESPRCSTTEIRSSDTYKRQDSRSPFAEKDYFNYEQFQQDTSVTAYPAVFLPPSMEKSASEAPSSPLSDLSSTGTPAPVSLLRPSPALAPGIRPPILILNPKSTTASDRQQLTSFSQSQGIVSSASNLSSSDSRDVNHLEIRKETSQVVCEPTKELQYSSVNAPTSQSRESLPSFIDSISVGPPASRARTVTGSVSPLRPHVEPQSTSLSQIQHISANNRSQLRSQSVRSHRDANTDDKSIIHLLVEKATSEAFYGTAKMIEKSRWTTIGGNGSMICTSCLQSGNPCVPLDGLIPCRACVPSPLLCSRVRAFLVEKAIRESGISNKALGSVAIAYPQFADIRRGILPQMQPIYRRESDDFNPSPDAQMMGTSDMLPSPQESHQSLNLDNEDKSQDSDFYGKLERVLYTTMEDYQAGNVGSHNSVHKAAQLCSIIDEFRTQLSCDREEKLKQAVGVDNVNSRMVDLEALVDAIVAVHWKEQVARQDEVRSYEQRIAQLNATVDASADYRHMVDALRAENALLREQAGSKEEMPVNKDEIYRKLGEVSALIDDLSDVREAHNLELQAEHDGTIQQAIEALTITKNNLRKQLKVTVESNMATKRSISALEPEDTSRLSAKRSKRISLGT